MKNNKYYPPELEEAVLKSLSYYPELAEVEIHFRYANRLRNSVMQAQPLLSGIFRKPAQRAYLIKISRQFKTGDERQQINELPFRVLVGWLGHELGHIMDYLHRSLPSLAGFGIGYIFSRNYMKGAERIADEYAVNYGMGEYIQATKNFILNHSGFSVRYKNKIRRQYLSPEEILALVQEKQDPGSLGR
jgi:hypothetical protein